jgi:hypothetical protein
MIGYVVLREHLPQVFHPVVGEDDGLLVAAGVGVAGDGVRFP